MPPPGVHRRVVRQAVVELMLGAMPPRRKERHCAQGNSLTDGKQGGHHTAGGEETYSQGGAYDEIAGDSFKCIMWCAIALGALVQGCSFDFVSLSVLDMKCCGHRCSLYARYSYVVKTLPRARRPLRTCLAHIYRAYTHRVWVLQEGDRCHLAC